MFSTLILTKNEEADLADCIRSIQVSDDIVVLDSYSTDKTEKIAKKFNVRFIKRKFDNWSSHQNWALKNLDFKNEWVFYIDADERATIELTKELIKISEDDLINSFIGYRVRRRDYFNNRHLKNVQATLWYLRFFKPNFIHYERLVNPVTVAKGKVGELRGFLNHFPFSKGISHWIERHNSYSSFEAIEIINSSNKKISINKLFFEKDYNIRKSTQKQLFYKIPLRPFIKFIYIYFFKKGFLDSYEGFIYALLQSIYEFFIVLKVKELNSSKKD